jgi:hypothetical protein
MSTRHMYKRIDSASSSAASPRHLPHPTVPIPGAVQFGNELDLSPRKRSGPLDMYELPSPPAPPSPTFQTAVTATALLSSPATEQLHVANDRVNDSTSQPASVSEVPDTPQATPDHPPAAYSRPRRVSIKGDEGFSSVFDEKLAFTFPLLEQTHPTSQPLHTQHTQHAQLEGEASSSAAADLSGLERTSVHGRDGEEGMACVSALQESPSRERGSDACVDIGQSSHHAVASAQHAGALERSSSRSQNQVLLADEAGGAVLGAAGSGLGAVRRKGVRAVRRSRQRASGGDSSEPPSTGAFGSSSLASAAAEAVEGYVSSSGRLERMGHDQWEAIASSPRISGRGFTRVGSSPQFPCVEILGGSLGISQMLSEASVSNWPPVRNLDMHDMHGVFTEHTERSRRSDHAVNEGAEREWDSGSESSMLWAEGAVTGSAHTSTANRVTYVSLMHASARSRREGALDVRDDAMCVVDTVLVPPVHGVLSSEDSLSLME